MTTPGSRPVPSSISLTEFTELVRDNEQQFLARVQPLVVRHDVTLDFQAIERIDAAGLAALITLYSDARKAGRRFAVAHPSLHVREILGLVGLDRTLLARYPEKVACMRPQIQQTAA